MITVEFYPNVSDEEIQQALNTKEGEEYPESVLRQKSANEMKSRRNKILALIGISPVVVFLGSSVIINVFKPGFLRMIGVSDKLCVGALYLIGVVALFALMASLKEKKEPLSLERAVRTFYSGLGLTTIPSYFKSYLILAPDTMKRISQEGLANTWKQVDDEIVSMVRYQDSATCAHCGKESNGLWAVNKWYFPDAFMRNAKLLVRCPDCSSIYCAECYVSFPKRHQCPNCGRKLKEIGPGAFKQGLETFMQDPMVRKVGDISNVQIDQQSERVADIVCVVIFSHRYEKIVKSDSLGAVNEVDLGERGKVICRFHNKAVKIGEDWRLLSAKAGEAIAI